MTFATVNPATGETLKRYESHSVAEVERRLQAAADAWPRHRRTTFAERARMMLRAAEILESEREEFGRLMVTEMGKPIQAAAATRPPSARSAAATTPSTPSGSWPTSRSPPAPARAGSPTSRSVRCWRSCPGTSPSGRSSASPRRRSWPATSGCSSTPSNVPQLRARDRGDLPPGRLRRRRVPDAPDRERAGGRGHRGPAGRRGDPHRQRAGPAPRWARAAGKVIKKTRAGAGRQRSLHRDAERRPRRRGGDRGHRPGDQQRPVLHRRQALHRARRRSPTSSSAAS